MSIASAITNAQTKIAAAYTACNNKGATMPTAANQNLSNLATTIGTISTGGTANLTTLSVTPSKTAQTITPTSPVDGYNQVNVSAVTSSIDPNITAGNIKSGVTILGVTGTYGGGSSLPYTPLEYIETDGTAYINSGINSMSLMTCDIKVKMNASISSSEIFVGTGSTDGANDTVNFLWHSSANQSKIGYGYYYLYSGRLTPTSFSSPFEVSTFLQNGYCYMSIKESGSSPVSVSHNLSRNLSNSTPFYIFATNNSGTAERLASSGSRIYYVRISYLSTSPSLVFDGVPALYNGEYGLWDNVTNSFFGNAAGSGAFTGA